MILRIIHAEVVGPTLLSLTFNDGTEKAVDAAPLLEGPIFVPLRDPARFAEALLDPVCGTVTWPNGADLAPEALRELSQITLPASTS
jgi:hypothetical protein